VNEDVKLRRAVAAVHGFDWKAANLLQGETVEELERSAAKLANLIGTHRQEEQAPTDIITAARRATAERKHRLAMLLTGREQPRDTAGRYSKPATSFDGGARDQASMKGPPEAEHNATLMTAIRSGESDVGSRL
jgi:hypothetical protein